MAGAIIVCRVGFGLNDNAGAAIPNKLDPDEFAGHSNHITLKKSVSRNGMATAGHEHDLLGSGGQELGRK
jgi:hypothetical protein